MKTLTCVLAATLCVAGPALAEPADDLVGTWECRQPGVEYRNKPPILYVEGTSAKDPKQAIVFEIDGFTREVYGISDMTAESDGWWKISPAQGQAFLVRLEGASKSKTATMALKRSGATYRCLRLPPASAQGVPASGTQSVASKTELSVFMTVSLQAGNSTCGPLMIPTCGFPGRCSLRPGG